MRYVIALMLLGLCGGCTPNDRWQYTSLYFPDSINSSSSARLVLNNSRTGDKSFDIITEESALNVMGEFGWQVISFEPKDSGKTYLLKRLARSREGYWTISVSNPKK